MTSILEKSTRHSLWRIRTLALIISAVLIFGSTSQFNKSMMWAYSGVKSLSVDERFKLMSVPAHVTAAFPPSYISSGNADPLAPQAVSLVQKLRDLGVRTDDISLKRSSTLRLFTPE
jgi:acetyl esterase